MAICYTYLLSMQYLMGRSKQVRKYLRPVTWLRHINVTHPRVCDIHPDIGGTTKISLPLVRMSFNGPDAHLMVHHGTREESLA